MRMLKRYLSGIRTTTASFVFHSRNGSPLRETNVLADGLHAVLKNLRLKRAGMHAFRHGTNRRWELAGTCRNESCRPSTADGTLVGCNDGQVRGRDSSRKRTSRATKDDRCPVNYDQL
jgi:hypothetical protein